MEHVTHNHLKRLLGDNPDFDDLCYMMELYYSSLIVPTFEAEGRTAFYLFSQELVPVFTDLEEYNRTYGGDRKLTPKVCDFDYILSANVDLIVNPDSDSHIIETDLLQYKRETPYYEYDSVYVGYSCRELELVARKTKNRNLKEFIRNPRAVYDYEAFFTKLRRSTLLIGSFLPDATGDVVDLTDSIAAIEIGRDGFLEFYTSMDEAKSQSYVQVANIAEFMEYIIRNDLEGFVINPESDSVRVTREMILLNFEEFRDNYNHDRYVRSHNYAFRVN